mmetsp:Transcript_38984/g.45419  ORF Transcript_38984/g.45419 Transcript_38984/m.45419 type:complete len:84 (+) Transcript_38984:433-684(+)
MEKDAVFEWCDFSLWCGLSLSTFEFALGFETMMGCFPVFAVFFIGIVRRELIRALLNLVRRISGLRLRFLVRYPFIIEQTTIP